MIDGGGANRMADHQQRALGSRQAAPPTVATTTLQSGTSLGCNGLEEQPALCSAGSSAITPLNSSARARARAATACDGGGSMHAQQQRVPGRGSCTGARLTSCSARRRAISAPLIISPTYSSTRSPSEMGLSALRPRPFPGVCEFGANERAWGSAGQPLEERGGTNECCSHTCLAELAARHARPSRGPDRRCTAAHINDCHIRIRAPLDALVAAPLLAAGANDALSPGRPVDAFRRDADVPAPRAADTATAPIRFVPRVNPLRPGHAVLVLLDEDEVGASL